MSRTDRYFVLGHPVAHSRSPFIHNAFAQQTRQALTYDRLECPLDGFATAVRALASDTAEGPVRACNVTVPFKFEALALAGRVTPRAALAQAANVLCFDEPGWLADNTDGAGLLRDLQDNEGLRLAGLRLLLVGAGGAAAGVLGPLLQAGPGQVVVANRGLARAEALVQAHAGLASAHATDLRACTLGDLAALHAFPFDVIINASASSLGGELSPIPPGVMAPGAWVVDLMYGPAAQPFLSWARAHGAGRTLDGLGMLVEQAAEAFTLWRGVRPATAPVLQALREALAPARPS